MPRWLPIALSTLLFALGACGGGAMAPASHPPPAEVGASASVSASDVASVASSPPPAPSVPDPTVQSEDVAVGTGDAAASGDHVTVHYVGTLTDGTVFDSSRKRSRPFDFVLGRGQVIKGWDQGVVGMKVGGRRKLVIPPSLAYGARGQPPTIPADSTLTFDVELLALEHAAAADAAHPRVITARHILIQYMGARSAESAIVRTREQARAVATEVLARAKAGDDFGRLAIEYSDEAGAGPRGGALGRFGKGKFVPEFDAAAFTLKPGEISGVVETPFGFHIIQRLE